MQKIRNLKVALSLFLAVILLGVFLLPTSTVLCFEANGDISIEVAGEESSCWHGAATTFQPDSPEGSPVLEQLQPSCFACRDFPLRDASLQLFLSRSRPDLLAALALPPAPSLVTLIIARETSLPTPEISQDSALCMPDSPFLLSVRLLI
jgi:hypothetical protein